MVKPPNMKSSTMHIVGAGLAGSEAAFQLARWGWPVVLNEMRPVKTTPAHRTDRPAELVCSNSFKSKDPISAPGILKRELTLGGCMILDAARQAEVPAGNALSVDRDVFSTLVNERLHDSGHVSHKVGEVAEPSHDALTLLATGPLTSEPLAQWLQSVLGETQLYFYDAIAPVVDAASLDRSACFLANRYGKGGEAAYVNCPLDRPTYEAFVDALLTAETVPTKDFEKEILFQGCQPIESIAKSGRESLRFGPMKPVGLDDPATGRRPHAVVQLRTENLSLTAYNLVGFQTKLKYGEQQRIFRMIPALRHAEFLRLGSMHRNTYVCSPRVLADDLSLRAQPHVFLAGQISGVEGYLESTAIGWLAAVQMALRANGLPPSPPPPNTALGSLYRFLRLTDPKHFVPNNMQFGIMDPAVYDNIDARDPDRKSAMAAQSVVAFEAWWNDLAPKVRPNGSSLSF